MFAEVAARHTPSVQHSEADATCHLRAAFRAKVATQRSAVVWPSCGHVGGQSGAEVKGAAAALPPGGQGTMEAFIPPNRSPHSFLNKDSSKWSPTRPPLASEKFGGGGGRPTEYERSLWRTRPRPELEGVAWPLAPRPIQGRSRPREHKARSPSSSSLGTHTHTQKCARTRLEALSPKRLWDRF